MHIKIKYVQNDVTILHRLCGLLAIVMVKYTFNSNGLQILFLTMEQLYNAYCIVMMTFFLLLLNQTSAVTITHTEVIVYMQIQYSFLLKNSAGFRFLTYPLYIQCFSSGLLCKYLICFASKIQRAIITIRFIFKMHIPFEALGNTLLGNSFPSQSQKDRVDNTLASCTVSTKVELAVSQLGFFIKLSTRLSPNIETISLVKSSYYTNMLDLHCLCILCIQKLKCQNWGLFSQVWAWKSTKKMPMKLKLVSFMPQLLHI